MQLSVGLVMVRDDGALLLVHPGGPFFAKKDLGAWSIPKGLPEPGEDLLACARREMQEETGFSPPESRALYVDLGEAKQTRKLVRAFAFRGDWDTRELRSNDFELEWPPKSGRFERFSEVDRASFFPLALAKQKAVPGQVPLLEAALRAFPPRRELVAERTARPVT